MRTKTFARAALAAALAPSMSLAAIVGTSGDMEHIAAPADANLNVVTSNTKIRVWNEQQNVFLASDITVDAVAPGVYDAAGDLSDTIIGQGTQLSSHYVHFDSIASQAAVIENASVTFDGVIIGVIVIGDGGAKKHLDTSDFLSSGTLYGDNITSRGYEMGDDRFSISADGLTFTVIRNNITTPGDFARVLTAVPEPGTMAALGIGAVALLRRRRK